MYIDKDTLVNISGALFLAGTAAVILLIRAKLRGGGKRAVFFTGFTSLVCVTVTALGLIRIFGEGKSHDEIKVLSVFLIAGQITYGAGYAVFKSPRRPPAYGRQGSYRPIWLLCAGQILYAAGITVCKYMSAVNFVPLFISAVFSVIYVFFCVYMIERGGNKPGQYKAAASVFLFFLFFCLCETHSRDIFKDTMGFIFMGSIFSAVSGIALCYCLSRGGNTGKGAVILRCAAEYIGQFLIALSLLRYDL